MGKLISVQGEWATYEYYPDRFSNEMGFGLFRVKPASLLTENTAEYEIINRLGTNELWYGRQDEHVVLALISKIKASAEAGCLYPSEIYHNA